MYTKLRFLMLKNNISLKDIAILLNLSRNTVSRKVNGKAIFKLDEIIKIRNKFFPEVSLETLSEKDYLWE